MFSRPYCGWTEIKIKDDEHEFIAPASYTTDIPNDCLDSFIYALETNNSVVIDFDAEGWEYKLVCSKYDTYVIEDKEDIKVYYFTITIRELIKEFLEDLEQDYNEWVWWYCYDEDDVPDMFTDKINRLKKLLNENH